MAKRTFDLLLSISALLLSMPLWIVIVALIKLSSPGPVFFSHKRVGMGFQIFFVHKFRTMVQNAEDIAGPLTVGDDPRLTRIGRFLRGTKIDELPQLINVVKGEMSLVGPRPEVPFYVEMFRSDYDHILKIRPGMTDIASLKYWNESRILGRAENATEEYVGNILPDKIHLAKEYLNHSTILFDLALIVRTLLKPISSVEWRRSGW